MNQKIIIDFEGSLTVDANKIEFMNIENEEVISGSIYLHLTDTEKQQFVINNVEESFCEAENIQWEKLFIVDNK